MQIFLSHSSRQKPLVREIKENLPSHLRPWIDEERLLFGDDISTSIETTISSETDYVIFFLDEFAVGSKWIQKELRWALEAESKLNRTILLTVLIDEKGLEILDTPELRNRKYLHLKDFNQQSVRSLAQSIISELFALVSRDLQSLRQPMDNTPSATISSVDTLIRAQAAIIHEIVFPYREANPILQGQILEAINARQETPITEDDLDIIISSIVQRNLVSGLVYDGYEAYIVEEHASWKSKVQHEKKERIGRKASTYLKNGMKIFLDAGSTTEEMVKVVCRKIQSKGLTNAVFATTSIKIADMISDCCVQLGFDDDSSAIRLYVPGGRIRLNTQAIVPVPDHEPRQISQLAELLGGFDIGIIGVNGIDKTGGFTTHQNTEVINKNDIMKWSQTSLIVGDSSKIGITLEYRFSDFSEDITLLIDEDSSNIELGNLVSEYKSKIILC